MKVKPILNFIRFTTSKTAFFMYIFVVILR